MKRVKTKYFKMDGLDGNTSAYLSSGNKSNEFKSENNVDKQPLLTSKETDNKELKRQSLEKISKHHKLQEKISEANKSKKSSGDKRPLIYEKEPIHLNHGSIAATLTSGNKKTRSVDFRGGKPVHDSDTEPYVDESQE